MYISPARAVRVVALAAILATATPLSRADPAACAPDNYTEAGTCAPPVVDPPMTDFQRKQQAEKDAALAAMADEEARGSWHAAPASTQPGEGGTPASYQLKAVQEMTIYREGQGNGKKSYTCGPSATRNMVAAMYKARTGKLKDLGEKKFEDWEETGPDGTSRAYVAKALNAHFSSFGHWTTSRPRTAAEYFNAVRVDTYRFHQSVIANVNTRKLSFFKGHDLKHFDFVYGYYSVGATRYLRIGEEYDRKYLFGTHDYNPYGHRHEKLSNAFIAITSDPIHGIVW